MSIIGISLYMWSDCTLWEKRIYSNDDEASNRGWRVTDLGVASRSQKLVAAVTLETQLVPVLPQ